MTTTKQISCSICNHPERFEIDRALGQPNASLRDLRKRFKVSAAELRRHRPHVAPAAVNSQIGAVVNADEKVFTLNEVRGFADKISASFVGVILKHVHDRKTMVAIQKDLEQVSADLEREFASLWSDKLDT